MRFTHWCIVLLICALPSMSLMAQSIAPQSVNSAGGKMTQVNGSLSFTVGELVVLSQTDIDGNTIGGGFTNSAVSSTSVVAISEPNVEVLNVSVYPNPVSDLVFVDIAETQLDWLIVEIYEVTGKLISSEKYAGLHNKIGINTQAFAAGTYLLNLIDESRKMLGSYTLIKQ
jgi:hypothetical protein